MIDPSRIDLEPLRPEHASAMFEGLADPATIRDRVADIGYHVFPGCWWQGFATTSIEEAHAFVDTRNIASAALLEKLGFDRLRTLIHTDHFKGASIDEYEFALPRRRWRT